MLGHKGLFIVGKGCRVPHGLHPVLGAYADLSLSLFSPPACLIAANGPPVIVKKEKEGESLERKEARSGEVICIDD